VPSVCEDRRHRPSAPHLDLRRSREDEVTRCRECRGILKKAATAVGSRGLGVMAYFRTRPGRVSCPEASEAVAAAVEALGPADVATPLRTQAVAAADSTLHGQSASCASPGLASRGEILTPELESTVMEEERISWLHNKRRLDGQSIAELPRILNEEDCAGDAGLEHNRRVRQCAERGEPTNLVARSVDATPPHGDGQGDEVDLWIGCDVCERWYLATRAMYDRWSNRDFTCGDIGEACEVAKPSETVTSKVRRKGHVRRCKVGSDGKDNDQEGSDDDYKEYRSDEEDNEAIACPEEQQIRTQSEKMAAGATSPLDSTFSEQPCLFGTAFVQDRVDVYGRSELSPYKPPGCKGLVVVAAPLASAPEAARVGVEALLQEAFPRASATGTITELVGLRKNGIGTLRSGRRPSRVQMEATGFDDRWLLWETMTTSVSKKAEEEKVVAGAVLVRQRNTKAGPVALQGGMVLEYIAAHPGEGGKGYLLVMAAEEICRQAGLPELFSACDLSHTGTAFEGTATAALTAHRRWGFLDIDPEEWRDRRFHAYSRDSSVHFMVKSVLPIVSAASVLASP